MAKLSIGQALRISWQSSKRDWRIWLLVSLIFMLANLPGAIFDLNKVDVFSFQSLLWLAVGLVIMALFSPGIQQNGLLVARGSVPTIQTLTGQFKLAGKFVLFYLLYALITTLGFIALIIPGLYLMARYSMTPFIMLDNPTLGVAEAMSQSSKLTKDKIWQLFVAYFVIGITYMVLATASGLILGIFLAFFIDGNTVTNLIISNILFLIPSALIMPFSTVGPASIYEQVKSQPTTVATADPVTAAAV
ncbi:MAG: hypothetical protein AAB669_02940 [Patescibacteria group bacterium]